MKDVTQLIVDALTGVCTHCRGAGIIIYDYYARQGDCPGFAPPVFDTTDAPNLFRTCTYCAGTGKVN